MAIHQRGFQWQAITRLPGSSARRLCCCRSLGPQPPNSPWKQYLYIYYIFTQYLPCCKTISYLTINFPMFFPLFFSSFHVSFQPSLLPYLSLYISPFSSFFFLLFFWVVFFFFFMPQFHFFQKRFFFSFFSIFLFTLYIDEIGFFCSPMEDNHCSNCHLIAKFHSTVKGRNTGERALKNSNSFYLSISVCASDMLSSSLLRPVILSSLSVSCPLSLLLKSGALILSTFCLHCVKNGN